MNSHSTTGMPASGHLRCSLITTCYTNPILKLCLQ